MDNSKEYTINKYIKFQIYIKFPESKKSEISSALKQQIHF